MKTLLVVLLLAGCANIKGVNISDEERQACEQAANGCSVWTDMELEGLARDMLQRGYTMGRKSL